jgi:hypothetical protein
VRTHLRRAGDALVHVDAEAQAELLRHRLRLQPHRARQAALAGIGGQHVERGGRQRADRVEGQVAPQRHPALVADMRPDRRLEHPEGGAIAHGHPIGATGAVLTTWLLHGMARAGQRRGLVTLCIGGGQGIALCLERIV